MKNLRAAVILLTSAAMIGPLLAGSSTITVKDSAGATQTYDVTTDVSGNFLSKTVTCDQSAGANCATVTGSNALKIDGSAVTQPVSGTFWQATQPVSAAALPLPSGAATSAKQPALGTAGSASADVITVQGVASMTALKVDGSAATQPVSGTVTANAGTNLNTSALALETGGNLATVVTNTNNLSLSQASTTSGQKGNLVQGAVTTAAPTYTTAQTDPLSLTTAGALRVDLGATSANATALKVDGSAVTQPVSGTFWQATQPVSGTVSITANSAVNVAQINGVTPLMGNGATGTGSPRVSIASDNSPVAGMGVAATGGAVPVNAVYIGANIGGNNTGVIACNSTAIYDASTSGSTQLVALSSGKVIYICGYVITTGATATNVKLQYGTGSNCGTGTTSITPAYQLAANSGIVDRTNFYSGLNAIASNELCINTSAGNAVQATVYYTQF